jgi:hypothetical protein
MFFTAVRQALYKTIWSRHPTVVHIDQDTQMSWTNTILWLSKEGKKDIPVYFNDKEQLEKEVDHIIYKFNEIEKDETTNKMINYLEMREEERKRKN